MYYVGIFLYMYSCVQNIACCKISWFLHIIIIYILFYPNLNCIVLFHLLLIIVCVIRNRKKIENRNLPTFLARIQVGIVSVGKSYGMSGIYASIKDL